jgi:hypothetical protein
VVCESIERIARVTYFSTEIEYELEQAGVASSPRTRESTHPRFPA